MLAVPVRLTVEPEPSDAGEIVPEMLGKGAAVMVTTELSVVEPWLAVSVTVELEETDPI
jgi:hypothetical protein